jgi:hypothetical protein
LSVDEWCQDELSSSCSGLAVEGLWKSIKGRELIELKVYSSSSFLITLQSTFKLKSQLALLSSTVPLACFVVLRHNSSTSTVLHLFTINSTLSHHLNHFSKQSIDITASHSILNHHHVFSLHFCGLLYASSRPL